MKLSTYEEFEPFWQAVGTTLLAEEAANNMFISRCLAQRDAATKEAFLAAGTHRGRLRLAAAHFPTYDLLLFAALDDEQPLIWLADQLSTAGRSVAGVIARRPAAGRFAAAWENRHGTPARLAMRHHIYMTRRVVPPRGVPGRLRPAGSDDISLLAEWMERFEMEAFAAADPLQAYAYVTREVTAGGKPRIFLWEDRQPVCMAVHNRSTLSGANIAQVYTPPVYRRRGYAAACTAALSQWLLDDGWRFCVLANDAANPSAGRIYQRIGYQPVGDADRFVFENA